MNDLFNKLQSRIRYMRYLESIGITDTVLLLWNKVFPQKSQIENYLPMFSGVGLEIGGPSSLFDSKGLMKYLAIMFWTTVNSCNVIQII